MEQYVMGKKTKKQKGQYGVGTILKTLGGAVREFKKPSLLAPFFVMLEVIMECLIPWIMTLLLGAIEVVTGTASNPDPLVVNIVNFLSGENENPNLMIIIIDFGLVLIGIAILSLICGAPVSSARRLPADLRRICVRIFSEKFRTSLFPT